MPDARPHTAFVLGGGGHLGAHEVGMLRALLERAIVPDVVLGTSIGAINGAAVAADPSPRSVQRLTETWSRFEGGDVFGGSALRRLGTLARSRTHLHDPAPLRDLLTEALPVQRIEDLPVPFGCVTACIETASERWFSEGPLVDAVLASCSVPGLLPPVRIGDEHFLEGGLVNSIPVSRAIALGARRIYVMQVGRVDRPLSVPRWPWEVGFVAFEIARRHRYHGDLAAVPADIDVHVMPTGQPDRAPAAADLSSLRYRDSARITRHIERAYQASARFLDEGGHQPRPAEEAS